MRAVLVCADLLAAALASLLAVTVWTAWQPTVDASVYLRLWPFLAVIPVGFWWLGMYPAAFLGPVEELRRSSVHITASFAAVVSVLYAAEAVPKGSLGAFVPAWLLVVVAVPLARAALRLWVARASWWGLPAVIFGAGSTARLLLEHSVGTRGVDLKVLACFDDDARTHGTTIAGTPVVGGLAEASRFQQRFRAQYCIVAMPGVEPAKLACLVQRHAGLFPHLIVVPNVFGLHSVGVGARDMGGFVGLYIRQNLLFRRSRIAKRAMDLALLLPVGLLALPVLLLAALAVVVVSPGNPFYAQRREGFRGRPVRVWKLRTMRKDAETLLESHLKAVPGARQEWEQHFKLTADPRLLPVIGRLFRRTSIDELPQLLNILKGEMSFVGPRPFPYYHVEQFGEDFRRLRVSALPGLTGYWQVTSRSTADLQTQERLDSYYVRNWSLWMDLYLLARTPLALIFGRGAY